MLRGIVVPSSSWCWMSVLVLQEPRRAMQPMEMGPGGKGGEGGGSDLFFLSQVDTDISAL